MPCVNQEHKLQAGYGSYILTKQRIVHIGYSGHHGHVNEDNMSDYCFITHRRRTAKRGGCFSSV